MPSEPWSGFGPLLDASRLQVISQGGVPRVLPVEAAERRVRDAVMRTLWVDLPGRGQFRAVGIESPKVHIVSMFLWAAPEVDAPSYAMEFVVFGPRPIVAVIDLVGLGGPRSQEVGSQMLREARRGRSFEAASDPPEWYRTCRSGDDFFVRPKHLEEVEALSEVHREVFANTLGVQREGAVHPDPRQHREAAAAYRAHHCANTPGRPWLIRSFGEAWTDWYLASIVFA